MFKVSPQLRWALTLLALAALGASPVLRTLAEPNPAPVTDSANFEQQIRPLLASYCLSCHSTEKQKGELDLEAFASLDAVWRDPKVWQKVAEQLANGEMPPKEKPQPTPAERKQLEAWVKSTLDAIALARAGDPGPVVLRRLSNAEFTYTIRDLTGVESLDPAREFPVDGAAGEGFTNTGQSLVMSPSLVTKYLDAGKAIAAHAVLLPDGIRFSPHTTRRDWTEELLAEIRGFYRQFTEPRGGGAQVNLQGIVFETNEGGRLALEKYLLALVEARDAIASGAITVDAVARERGLSAKYLSALLAALNGKEPSPLLEPLRARWRDATPADVPTLVAAIEGWQKSLWKFSSVGHIGKVGGPKAWMEPVSPLATKQDIRVKLLAPAPGAKDVVVYLVASDAGDGDEQDVVVWEQPRLVAPGRPDLMLRDVRAVSRELARRRELIIASTARCLNAAAETSANQGKVNIAELARRHEVDAEALASWLSYLGIGPGGPVTIESHFTEKVTNGTYEFIRGWGSDATPSVIANSSDQHVRVPGNMKPHGVAVHPSPTLAVAVGWQSAVAGAVRIDATVGHAHPECGNGVTWSLELRRGATRQRLASGVAQGQEPVKVPPVENLAIEPGDLISLLIGPRDGNHSCDLTAVDLTISTAGEQPQKWNLAADVSPDIQAANPHADRLGNASVWHFYTEPDSGGTKGGPVIPAGSALAKWQATPDPTERARLAEAVQKLLATAPPADPASADAQLYRQLLSFGGPLLPAGRIAVPAPDANDDTNGTGPDPSLFGKHPDGQPIDPANLCARAPSVVEVRIPEELADGCELVTTATLAPTAGKEGSVQVRVSESKPDAQAGLVPSTVTATDQRSTWSDGGNQVSVGTPILVGDDSPARKRFEAAFDEFRNLFPAALCYTKIVPVDEVVTLTLMHREDHHLARLMHDDAQRARLDRLWDELHYVSQDAFQLVDAFAQLMEYATQDADPSVFEPMRKPINDRAAALRQRLIETEPAHVEAILRFAERAYRRPLDDSSKQELRSLYAKLRAQDLPHEDSIRLLIARVLVAPAFLYRAETPPPGPEQGPVKDWELASRLSYFLWSSMPDDELRAVAAAGKLRDPDTLAGQTRRMLADPRARRLATEFALQWLHIRDLDTLDEKSERHFPTFVALRGAMHEEAVHFFTDFFQHDRSVLSILDAHHTFLNQQLAEHYGIPNVTGEQWRRVDGVRQFARGGILAQAATLAKQSGASRTSPILRGNWVAEVLLGDKLPRPPKDVPVLPEDEATEQLTVRQLTERHSSDPRCAGCHKRIDAFGFSLERFDAIGRFRDRDLGDRPIDTTATVMDGTVIDGIDGLRDYLLTKRRDAFLRQFCRKLLGYALGRGVQLSDEPLLAEMQSRLQSSDYRIGVAIDAIVRSRQFREIRGRDAKYED